MPVFVVVAMTPGFHRAVEFVLSYEQEWGTVPGDRGGPTRWGISSRAHPDVDLSTLTRDGAIEIYRSDYWDLCWCDELPWPVSLAVFDGAVQHGPETIGTFLQVAADASPIDGDIGPVTVAAVRAGDPAVIFDEVMALRAKYYDTIDDRHLGWWRRVVACIRLGIETEPSKGDPS